MPARETEDAGNGEVQATPAESAATRALGDDLDILRHAFPKGVDDLKTLAVPALVALGAGWVANYALNSQVSGAIPSGSLSSQIAHGLAWFLVALTAAVVVASRIAGGAQRFGVGFRQDAGAALAAVTRVSASPGPFLWGFASAGAVAWLLGSALFSAALLVALTAALVNPPAHVALGILLAAGQVFRGRFSPNPGPSTFTDARVFILGAMAASAVALAFSGGPVLVVLVVAAAVVAVVMAQRRRAAHVATGVFLLTLVALVMTACDSSPAPTPGFSVPADKAFVSTGVTVKAGDTLTIDASGEVHFLGHNPDAVADPDGGPAHYWGCGGITLCGALTGRIAKGVPFLVGKHYSARVETAGPLELGINDYQFTENSGTFSASIQVSSPAAGAAGSVPPPAVSPLPVAPAPRSATTGGFVAAFAAALGAALGLLLGRGLGNVPAWRGDVYRIGAAEIPGDAAVKANA